MSNFRHFSWSLVLLLTVPISVLGAGSARNLTATFEKLHEQAAQLESEWESEAAGDDKREDVSDEGEEPELELATFGNGCFWCTEAIFEELHGVYDVVSGYSGGRVPNPTYKQVCTGLTGHAEVIQMKYNPELISYATLLEVFFRTHDPTTKNRQGSRHRHAVPISGLLSRRTPKSDCSAVHQGTQQATILQKACGNAG